MIRVSRHHSIASCLPVLELLAEHARTPFARPGWLAAHAPERGLLVLVVHEGETPLGFAALHRTRGITGVPVYRFVGHRASNYLEPVAVPGCEEVVWRGIITALRAAGGGVLDALDLSTRSPFLEAFEGAASGAHRVRLYPCPEAPLGASWDDTFRTLVGTSKRRTELRKFAARLGSLGEVRFQVYRSATDAGAVDGLLHHLAELHRARFERTTNTVMRGPGFERLRAGVVRGMGEGANVSVIEIDSIPVSFIIGFEADGTFIDYVPAFHPALARFSLGHVHLMLLMQWLIARGFTLFDFSKGDAAYKRRWAASESWNYRYVLPLGNGPLVRAQAAAIAGGTTLVVHGREHGYNAHVKRLLGRILAVGRGGSRPAARPALAHLAPGGGVADPAGEPFSLGRVATLPLPALRRVCEWRYDHPAPTVRVEMGANGLRVWDQAGDARLEVGA